MGQKNSTINGLSMVQMMKYRLCFIGMKDGKIVKCSMVYLHEKIIINCLLLVAGYKFLVLYFITNNKQLVTCIIPFQIVTLNPY